MLRHRDAAVGTPRWGSTVTVLAVDHTQMRANFNRGALVRTIPVLVSSTNETRCLKRSAGVMAHNPEAYMDPLSEDEPVAMGALTLRIAKRLRADILKG